MSGHLRGLGPLTRAYLLQSLRSRTAMFWTLVFPLLWLFLFGFIFFRDVSATVFMPMIFTITIISNAFFGVSYLLVNEREKGILRRYRVTPVSAFTVVTANALRAMVTMILSIGLQALVGRLVFGPMVQGSWILTLVAILLGAAAFVPLGLMVGSIAQDMRTAPAINNLLFFPLVFATGATVPFWSLPGWVQALGRMLPSSYLMEVLQGVMLRGEGPLQLWAPALVLVLSAIVGGFLNSWLFRWESSQPLNRRRLAWTVVGLLVLFTIASFASPEFQMSTAPEFL